MRGTALALALLASPTLAQPVDLPATGVPPMEISVRANADGGREWTLVVGWTEKRLRKAVPDVEAFLQHNVARLLGERQECPGGWQIDRRESNAYAVLVHGRCR